MNSVIIETMVNITFEDSFPYAGEVREIVRDDQSEWLVQVLEISKLEWKVENGKVVGATGEMKIKILEEVRPASQGKLKLV